MLNFNVIKIFGINTVNFFVLFLFDEIFHQAVLKLTLMGLSGIP